MADCPTPHKQVFTKPMEFRPNKRGVMVGTYKCACGYHHLTAAKRDPRPTRESGRSHGRQQRLTEIRNEQLLDRLFISE